MITIGFSTKEIDNYFIDHIKKTCGPKNIEIIPFVNKGTHSLSEAYNFILDKSSNDIVVLCHDDIYFDKKGWGSKIIKHFNRNEEYGIIGVAGSVSLPKSGMWWEDKTKMKGIVNHEHNGKKWESKYSNSLGNKLDETVIVDGVFISLSKNRIKHNFDESVKGFHLYDVSFSFRNFLSDVKIGVMYDVRLTHKSIGQTNQEWENNRREFAEKYKDLLPKKVIRKQGDLVNILCLNKDMNKETLKLISNFNSTIINEKDVTNSKKLPCIIVGDGVLELSTPQGNRKSVKDRYYMSCNISYDLIISDSEILSNKIKYIYGNTPHISIENNNSKHRSINKVKILNTENIFDFINGDVKNDVVKIVTGYSDKGGSTTALSNLVNFFNDNGIDCTMYGPHDYHLKLCKSDLLDNLKFNKSDKVITHAINLGTRPEVEKVVLSSHEKWWFRPSQIPTHWDSVVFLHDDHRKYHSDYEGEYEIIPNLKEKLYPIEKTDRDMIAGIIGAIEDRKQTHVSINRALEDNCEKVLLYGRINDINYFNSFVKPLLSDKVVLMDYTDNKQDMYNSIGRVYHSSKGEVACLVKDECYLTNTKFYGNSETNHKVSELTNNEILEKWINILNL